MARDRKVIVTCAVTGAIHTPTMSPALPCGVMGVSQAAIDAANAGASMVHVHCRKDDGEPTSDLDVWGQVLSRIKANSDVIVGVTTGGAIGMSLDERIKVVPTYKPEVASFNGGSMNFNLEYLTRMWNGKEPLHEWEPKFLKNTARVVFQNTFEDMRHILDVFREAGTVPEFEIFDFGQIANVRQLWQEGRVPEPLYFQFVPGIMGGIPVTVENMLYFKARINEYFGDKANYSMIIGGRRNFRYETLNVITGGNVRIGLEDSLYIKPNGELAVSNAQQVEKLIKVLHDLDFEIATPDEAREILHTKGKNNVNF